MLPSRDSSIQKQIPSQPVDRPLEPAGSMTWGRGGMVLAVTSSTRSQSLGRNQNNAMDLDIICLES